MATTVLRMPERPYPGLRPFEDFEAGIFFGRERHRNRLLEILQRERFLAVVGPSGSGKSSLVRAGLLPVLPLGAVGTGPDWHVATMRPGNKPLRNLATELLKPPLLRLGLCGGSGADGGNAVDPADITRVETALRRGPHSLLDLVVTAKANAGCSAHNVLVLVDQFEELFTYAEAGDRQADESDAFVNLLLAAREEPAARLFVATTMRTDFLGHCVRFLDLPEALNRSQYLTPRLSRDEIRDAISQPAFSFGGDIDPPLVEELINAVQENPDQLPVLQHALARMWELAAARDADAPRIVTADLAAVGGVNGALSRHGEQLLAKLSPAQRLDAEWLFRAITAERSGDGGGQRVRRPQALDRIAQWSGQPWPAFVPIIQRFSESSANFVTYRGQPGEPADGQDTVVDLSHESLMRQWGTLEQWVRKESDCASEYHRLCERMADEQARKGSLLTGGDLQRALAWLSRGLQLGAEPGKSGRGEPTAAWARRYDSVDAATRAAAAAFLRRVDEQYARYSAAAATRFGDVTSFIQRSDKREKLGNYTLRGLTALVVVSSIGMAWLGYSQYRDGLQSQVASLWSDIRVGNINEPLSEAAAQKVHDVAHASLPIRQRFAHAGIEQPRLQPSLFAGSGIVLRGAVGLDDQLRGDLAQQLRKLSATADRNRVVDAVVLGMLGESAFDDWKLAFMSSADAAQASQLVAHFGAVAAAAPQGQRDEWADQLLKLASDPTVEVDLLPTLGAAIDSALAQASSARVGQAALTLHGLLKRLPDRSRRDALARRVGALAKRMDAASLTTLAQQWTQDVLSAPDADLLRTLRTEVRLVTEAVPAPLLQAWAEPLVARLGEPAVPVGLTASLQAVAKRIAAQPQLVLPVIQAAVVADDATLRQQRGWLERLLDEASDAHPQPAFELALRMARVGLEEGASTIENLAASANSGPPAGSGDGAIAAAVTAAFAANPLGGGGSVGTGGTVGGESAIAIGAGAIAGPSTAGRGGVATSAPDASAGSSVRAGVARLNGWRARVRQEIQTARGAEKDALVAVAQALERGERRGARESGGGSGGSGGGGLPGARHRADRELSVAVALREIRATVDPNLLSGLGRGLAAAIVRLPETEALPAFDRLLADVKASNDNDQLDALAKGMRAATARAPAAMRMRFVDLALGTLKQPAVSLEQGQAIADTAQQLLAAVSNAEAAEAGKTLLDAMLQVAPPEAQRSANAAVTVSQQSSLQLRTRRQTAQRVALWRGLLIAVSQRLARDEEVLAPWTQALLAHKAEAKQPGQGDAIGDALAATEAGQPAARVAQVFDALLAILPTERQALKAIAAGRAPVSSGDDEDDDSAAVDADGKAEQSLVLAALPRLAARLSDGAATERLAAVVRLRLADVNVKRQVLQGLVAGRSGAAVAQMQGMLLDALAREPLLRSQRAIVRAVAAITDKQPPAVQAQTATDVARRLLRLPTGEGAQARLLAELLSTVIATRAGDQPSVLPDPALARLLVESCKVPYMDRTKVAAAVRRAEPQAPPASQGLWDFLRWAVKRYGIAVEKPPGQPAA